jgi:nitroimidazol reductase NimA-like FMN-containing flavoprotein (pyridoxamine 5'-phosphate oxidase superfamily)
MNEPIELSERECRELLAREVFGRLAFNTASGPRIVPLNYVVLDDAFVFRTTPYSEVAREAVGHDVAFEIDSVDHSRQTGWSVVAVGSLESVHPAELDELHKAWVPRPWAGGQRHLYVRLRWREVTGRRIPD